MRLYIGLVHYPVYNKKHQIIASAITTLDLHDIARLARTYGVKRAFIITPLKDQQELAERVRGHWTEGYGAHYNRHRKEAIELIEIVSSLEHAIDAIAKSEGKQPLVIATDASEQQDRSITYKKTRGIIQDDNVVIVIFGTAWGLGKTIMGRADHILEPISGGTEYRHLSVRTAAAIIIDRLAG